MQNLRFNRYGDGSKGRGERYTVQKRSDYTSILNTVVRSRRISFEVRQEWRKGYKVLVDANRSAKRFIQENPDRIRLDRRGAACYRTNQGHGTFDDDGLRSNQDSEGL